MSSKFSALTSKFLLFVAIVLGLTSLVLLKAIGANAQVPAPFVPCGQTSNPEFHSLRPYQASPCGEEDGPQEELALFCGNDLLIKREVEATKIPGVTRCEDIEGNKELCFFSISGSSAVAINLEGAEFPIAGNTELVRNSQSQDESLDDSDKVNEYVSWYLSGVLGQGEYGGTDPETPEGKSKIVDYSGPLQKLLSWTSLNQYRAETVERARSDRHDQVVGCVTPVRGQIDECPSGREIRLSSWKGNLPPEEKSYNNFKDYWLDYKRWLGDICFSAFGLNVCFDNPLSFRYPGSLFSYIPLSSTEDKTGLVETETVEVQTRGDVTLSNVVFTDQQPAKLFTAHMEELTELAGILQKTFIPQGEAERGGTSQVSPNDYCDLAQIRTNPGDDLFAGEITGTLTYTADFSCDFDLPEVGAICTTSKDCAQNETCPAGRCRTIVNNSCKKNIFINLSVITKTPLVDEAWERFVAGPASIVKRLFPKIGEGSPISAFLDIPGATKVNYSGEGLIEAGNPSSERSGESAELYFPHLGSISEYFLKGIQTLLRPKGFGEPILSGQPGTISGNPTKEGDIDCNQNAPDVNIPGLISKDNFGALADRWINSSNFANECYNDVVRRAIARGVNPAYFLFVWLYESGASNFSGNYEDFGVHLGDVVGFDAQIDRSLITLAGGVLSYCANNGVPPWSSQLYGYLACYIAGDANQSASDYQRLKERVQDAYNNFANTLWPTLSGGCSLPTGPTDKSCP